MGKRAPVQHCSAKPGTVTPRGRLRAPRALHCNTSRPAPRPSSPNYFHAIGGQVPQDPEGPRRVLYIPGWVLYGSRLVAPPRPRPGWKPRPKDASTATITSAPVAPTRQGSYPSPYGAPYAPTPVIPLCNPGLPLLYKRGHQGPHSGGTGTDTLRHKSTHTRVRTPVHAH